MVVVLPSCPGWHVFIFFTSSTILYIHTYIHYITFTFTLHYITLHYITLHTYITLHYVALRTLHYMFITLHYMYMYMYITLHTGRQQTDTQTDRHTYIHTSDI